MGSSADKTAKQPETAADDDACAQASTATDEASEQPLPRDLLFRVPRKKGKIKIIDPPTPPLEGPVADTHAHLSMIDAPLALARCAAYGVRFVVCIADVDDDAETVYESLDSWRQEAAELAEALAPGRELPRLRLVVGCHPHNAKDYDDALEEKLRSFAADPRTVAIGEIGLDYHYDLSPREAQREVFARQIKLAKQLELPLVLHVREAHADAFALLEEAAFPLEDALLHCCGLSWGELEPWVAAGCHVAYGGAFTFTRSDELRQAAAKAPLSHMLTETDAPFMAPVPLRGSTCLPDYVIFTAAAMAQEFGYEPGPERAAFLERLYHNALAFLDRPLSPWQQAHQASTTGA